MMDWYINSGLLVNVSTYICLVNSCVWSRWWYNIYIQGWFGHMTFIGLSSYKSLWKVITSRYELLLWMMTSIKMSRKARLNSPEVTFLSNPWIFIHFVTLTHTNTHTAASLCVHPDVGSYCARRFNLSDGKPEVRLLVSIFWYNRWLPVLKTTLGFVN